LSSAVLIGTQFWYADQGGIYVLWYLPLFLLMVFRPNLEDRRPPIIRRETDWLYRFRAIVARPFGRSIRATDNRTANILSTSTGLHAPVDAKAYGEVPFVRHNDV
jgi:hypothetical protein